MATKIFKNNAASVFASTVAGVLPVGGLSFTVATGGGAKFPAPVSGEHFDVTLFEKDGSDVEENYEIVRCTAVTGNTFTLSERDIESLVGVPGGRAYPTTAGRTVYVQMRVTAGTLANFVQRDATEVVENKTYRAAPGTVSAPTLSFSGDPDTGIYNATPGAMYFACNAVSAYEFNSTSARFNIGTMELLPTGLFSKFLSHAPNTATAFAGFFARVGDASDTTGPNTYGALYNDRDLNAVVLKSGNVGSASKPINVYLDSTRLAAFETTGNFLIRTTKAMGYGAGAGNSVTQLTNRNTGVTIDAPSGKIKLASAAGSATWASFVVTNNTVGVDDCILITQRNGTDVYEVQASAVANGSFTFSFHTTGGTTTEQPEFNFVVIKGSTS